MISGQNLLQILLVIIIVVFCIWVLYNMNKKLKTKITTEKLIAVSYRNKLKKIQKIDSPEKQLEEINKLAIAFFKDRLKIKQNLTYLEFAEEFEKQKKSEHKKFCICMSDLLYSGVPINKKNIKSLISSFEKIIE